MKRKVCSCVTPFSIPLAVSGPALAWQYLCLGFHLAGGKVAVWYNKKLFGAVEVHAFTDEMPGFESAWP